MERILKYSAYFFGTIGVGLCVALIFRFFILDKASDYTMGNAATPRSGVVRATQLNRMIDDNVYPNLNSIIKEFRNQPPVMKEKIEIAYRSLPPTQNKPIHGAIVSDNNSGPISGLIMFDTTRTPDFDTLLILFKIGDKDIHGNPVKTAIMIEGGKTIEIPVPEGSYAIEIVSGVAWFGPTEQFGPISDRLAFDGTYIFGKDNMGYRFSTYPNRDADFRVEAVQMKAIQKRDRGIKEKIANYNAEQTGG